jgi:hypothetical protein
MRKAPTKTKAVGGSRNAIRQRIVRDIARIRAGWNRGKGQQIGPPLSAAAVGLDRNSCFRIAVVYRPTAGRVLADIQGHEKEIDFHDFPPIQISPVFGIDASHTCFSSGHYNRPTTSCLRQNVKSCKRRLSHQLDAIKIRFHKSPIP